MVCFRYLHEGSWLGYNYYTPEVLVSIAKPDGSGQVNFVMEADSGAAISLLPSGAATALGLNLTKGVPIELGGVGGAIFTAYVHELDVVIGDVAMNIPIAFAPTSGFPPLLGRLGLYDLDSVLMGNTSHVTCVGEVGATSSPPPSACAECENPDGEHPLIVEAITESEDPIGPARFLDINIGWEVALIGGLLLVVLLVK